LSRPRNEFEESSIAPGAETLRRAAEELEGILRSSQRSVRTPELPPAESSALIDRIVAIITTLCGQPLAELTLPDLSTLWGTRSVATRRLAESACDAGLIIRSDERSWTIGPTLLRWSATLGINHELSEIVDEDLQSLSEQTGETITLTLYDAGEGSAHIARSHVGARNVRYVLDEGSDVPLTAGAAGKAILAYLPRTAAARASSEAHVRAEELEHIRAQGWASTDRERVPDAHGIAAPFFINGTVSGSVTATIPNHRIAGTPAEELVTAVVQTADRLTRLLSTHPQAPPAHEEPKVTKSQESRTPVTMAR
jgi:DNA-binding IclR family transcriptional regulator